MVKARPNQVMLTCTCRDQSHPNQRSGCARPKPIFLIISNTLISSDAGCLPGSFQPGARQDLNPATDHQRLRFPGPRALCGACSVRPCDCELVQLHKSGKFRKTEPRRLQLLYGRQRIRSRHLAIFGSLAPQLWRCGVPFWHLGSTIGDHGSSRENS